MMNRKVIDNKSLRRRQKYDAIVESLELVSQKESNQLPISEKDKKLRLLLGNLN